MADQSEEGVTGKSVGSPASAFGAFGIFSTSVELTAV
jgi:hypothetical protein